MRGHARRILVALTALLVLAAGVLPSNDVFAAGTGSYPGPALTSYPSFFACIHIVRRGETLTSIAARFGTTVQALMLANGIRHPSLIFAGMRLRVPCAPSPCVAAVYIVRPGDNLFRIGLRFGVSPYALAVANGLRNVNLVFAGMRLVIPCHSAYSTGGGYGGSGGYSSGGSYGGSGGYSGGGYSSGSGGYQPPATYPTPMPGMNPPPTPPGNSTSTVSIAGMAFQPASLTVHVGDTVTWRNNESSAIPHTTTSGSCSGASCAPNGLWDSNTLQRGQSFSHTFTAAGTFTYYCKIHGASMQGTIVVMP